MSTEPRLPQELRPQFFNSVVGPIGHYLAVHHAELIERQLAKIPLSTAEAFRQLGENTYEDPNDVMDRLFQTTDLLFSRALENLIRPCSFPVTAQQSSFAPDLFLMKQSVFERTVDGLIARESTMTTEITSVVGGIRDLMEHTLGVDSGSLDAAIDFCDHDGVYESLRVLMSGAEGFDQQLFGGGAATKVMLEFLKDRSKREIAEIIDGTVVLHDDVKILARDHRKEWNVKQERLGVEGNGETSGCPMKAKSFDRYAPLVQKHGLSLTDQQIAVLTSGENPVVVPYRRNGLDDIFVVRRDGVKAFMGVTKKALEHIRAQCQQTVDRNQPGPYAQNFAANMKLICITPRSIDRDLSR